jgi:hypothetical protein
MIKKPMRATQQLSRHRAAERKPEEQNSFLERKEQRTSAPRTAPPPSSRAQRGDPSQPPPKAIALATEFNDPQLYLIIEKPCAQPNSSAGTAQQSENKRSKTPFLKERSKELPLITTHIATRSPNFKLRSISKFYIFARGFTAI